MSLIRGAILIAVGLGVLGLDAGASWRAGSVQGSSVSAQPRPHHRRRHHRRHHRRRRHHRAPPATEL